MFSPSTAGTEEKSLPSVRSGSLLSPRLMVTVSFPALSVPSRRLPLGLAFSNCFAISSNLLLFTSGKVYHGCAVASLTLNPCGYMPSFTPLSDSLFVNALNLVGVINTGEPSLNGYSTTAPLGALLYVIPELNVNGLPSVTA